MIVVASIAGLITISLLHRWKRDRLDSDIYRIHQYSAHKVTNKNESNELLAMLKNKAKLTRNIK